VPPAIIGLLLLAAESPGPGRADNPSDVGGILIIVGITVVVVASFALGLWTVIKRRV
jgi:hypothetical protein